MTGKINFLSALITHFSNQPISFVDFDTSFSSYVQNNVLHFSLNTLSNLKTILPLTGNIHIIFDNIMNSLSNSSILILDSLNGLIDFLNISNLEKSKNPNILHIKNRSKDKSAGYHSLIILFLLLKKIENNKIPIIVTSYRPYEILKNMMDELLTNNDYKPNHFFKISDLVLFLEFIEKDNKTGLTLLKKNVSDLTNVNEKNSQAFQPYSRWYYYNFFKL
ncbi:MAG TPA: hypothetical protein VIY08_06605 [Candidatus Nitrosocosmicus sp.]